MYIVFFTYITCFVIITVLNSFNNNNKKKPANVVNLSKSAFLHADVMQGIVGIPCQIVAADIDQIKM